jgi:hypothetical protein
MVQTTPILCLVQAKRPFHFNEAKNKIDAIALYSCSNLQEYNKSYIAKHFFSLKK